MKIATALIVAVTTLAASNLVAASKPAASAAPVDSGWPRQRANEKGSLVYYQPQIDAWTNFKDLTFRMAFSAVKLRADSEGDEGAEVGDAKA